MVAPSTMKEGSMLKIASVKGGAAAAACNYEPIWGMHPHKGC